MEKPTLYKYLKNIVTSQSAKQQNAKNFLFSAMSTTSHHGGKLTCNKKNIKEHEKKWIVRSLDKFKCKILKIPSSITKYLNPISFNLFVNNSSMSIISLHQTTLITMPYSHE
jgi:hypothetical protein